MAFRTLLPDTLAKLSQLRPHGAHIDIGGGAIRLTLNGHRAGALTARWFPPSRYTYNRLNPGSGSRAPRGRPGTRNIKTITSVASSNPPIPLTRPCLAVSVAVVG